MRRIQRRTAARPSSPARNEHFGYISMLSTSSLYFHDNDDHKVIIIATLSIFSPHFHDNNVVMILLQLLSRAIEKASARDPTTRGRRFASSASR